MNVSYGGIILLKNKQGDGIWIISLKHLELKNPILF